MRFTLSKILVAVAMAAVACWGMTQRSPIAVSAVVSLTLGWFAWMALRAIALQGTDGAFAAAFCVVGSVYLLLATTNFVGLQRFLITNYPTALAARLFKVDIAHLQGINIDEIVASASSIDHLREFFLVSHCAWSWLLGLIAGWLCVWLYRRAAATERPS